MALKGSADVTSLTVNEESVDVDFRVESNNKTHAIFVDGGTDKVLILSGGATTDPSYGHANAYTDTVFYVSGANSSVDGGLGFGTKGGVSTFGGDVHISGSFRMLDVVTGVYEGYQYTEQLLNTVEFGGGQYDSMGNTVVGHDVVFWVSGGIGKTQDTSTGGTISSFGGDLVVSGALYARQKHITTHKSTPGNANQHYVKFNTAGTDESPGVNNNFVAPYSGKLLSAVFRSTSAAGSTAIAFHKNTNGNSTLNTSETEAETVNIASANTTYMVMFSETSIFNFGEILGISVDPTNDPGNWDLTAVWEFNTYEGTEYL
jgi:hypothetical protein